MCKIVVLTNMKKIKTPKIAIEKIASQLAKVEGDGFGYAIQGDKGVFGERTLEPDAFRSGFSKQVINFPFLDPDANVFGIEGKPVGAGIFHGRTSTNEATLINTHPIVKHDWTLIHNGVVTNHGPAYETITTNDTEHLVHYLANGGIDELAKNLSGYYAAAAFDPTGALHVFRDNRATLFMARLESVDSYIIATTKQLIINICKDLKLPITSMITPIKDSQYIVFRDNAVESTRDFTPRGATDKENVWARKSLGEYGDYLDRETHELDTNGWQDRWTNTSWDENEMAFFEEVNLMDHTYKVLDFRNNPIPLEEFFALEQDEQLCCTIIRPDGTLMDPNDKDADRLFMGNVA